MQITLDFTDEQWARITAAVGRRQRLMTEPVLDDEQKVVTPAAPRDATEDEVTLQIAGLLEDIVHDQEQAAAREAAASAVQPLGVSAALAAQKVSAATTTTTDGEKVQ